MDQQMGISLSSRKYLQRLQVAANDDPFKTRVISSQPGLSERNWDVNEVDDIFNQHQNSQEQSWECDEVADIFHLHPMSLEQSFVAEKLEEAFDQPNDEPELLETSNLEDDQHSETPIENSFTMKEADIQLSNRNRRSFDPDRSLISSDFFKSPSPKRQRKYNVFDDGSWVENEFVPESDFNAHPWNFFETGYTEALFGESSATVRTERRHKMKQLTSGFSSIANFSLNQLDTDMPVAGDDHSPQNDLKESFIDCTMMPERCRDGLLEKTLMQNENVVVNTAYKTRSLLKTTRHLIDNFYKVQIPKDWKEVAENMKKMMEPNFDYLQAKIFPDMTVEIGEERFTVNLADEPEFEDIDESLEEISQSFNTSFRSIVASTPNKSLITRVDKTSGTPSKSTAKCQEQEPIAKCSKASDADNHPEQSENNFNFSIIDPADFMFSRTIFPDLPTAFGQSEVEPSFHGFTNECLAEVQVQAAEDDLDSRRMSSLLEIFSLQTPPLLAAKRRAAIITQIGNIFHSLLQSLVHQKPMVLKIRTIRSWQDCEMNNEVLSQNETKITTKSINFSNKASERTFTITLTIMCEIYKMLMRNLTCAKRELYYRDVELFRNQESVNKAIDTICAMLNVQEFELGIISSSKGLIAGNLIINIGDERVDCSTTRAVPQNPSGITSFESNAEFVLVVEKDTVFQRLVTDSLNFQQIKTNIILVTAKGYPDVNTRVLLKKMSQLMDKPIYIIVDADPHGIEIMCTYKYGSFTKVHNSEHLAVPNMQWIGIHPSDIDSLDIIHVDLTDADLKKVDELLERPYMNPFLKAQLNCLKYRRLKAEIESIYVYSIDFLINEYIPRKIRTLELPPIP